MEGGVQNTRYARTDNFLYDVSSILQFFSGNNHCFG